MKLFRSTLLFACALAICVFTTAGSQGAEPAKNGKTANAPEKKTEAASKTASPAAKPAESGKDAKPKSAEESKPTVYQVKKRPMKIEVSLDGVFEAQNMTEVVFHTDEWSEFSVLKAVEHGSRVARGEVLVTFDTERIDRTIADLKRDQITAQIALDDAELQLAVARANAPLDLAASERSQRNAHYDLDYFLKVERPQVEKNVNFMVTVAENYLAYEEEELRQLTKMYKADDLVEETEEIILRRARDSVARAKYSLDRMKIERDAVLKTTLPRAEELFRVSTARADIDANKVRTSQPGTLRKLELALEKQRTDFTRSKQRLQRLETDRAAMDLRAPNAGLLYYGRFQRGRWSGGDAVGEKLRRGGRLINDDVFMTIVEARPLAFHTSVSEKQYRNVAAGMKGYVQPTAFPEARLTAIVQKLGTVPMPSGSFDALLTVAIDDSVAALMPGMGGDAKLIAYQKDDALAVPVAAVATDDADPKKGGVYLPSKDGKPQRRDVTIGKRSDKLVEIVAGLKEGEEILADAPKDKEKP